MAKPEDVRRMVGQRALLHLAPQARLGPRLTGRIVGVIEAADGLVVTVEPEENPGARLTIHYHHIVSVKQA